MHSRKISRLLTLVVSFAALACSSDPSSDKQQRRQDPGPHIRLNPLSPSYLGGNTYGEIKIAFSLRIGRYVMSMDDMLAEISSRAIVQSRPGGEVVPGRWVFGTSTAMFKPEAPLPKGIYSVRFTRTDENFVVWPYPYTVFAVGPVFWVERVKLTADKAASIDGRKGLTKVSLVFGGTKPRAGSTITIETKEPAGWQTLSATKSPTREGDLRLAQTLTDFGKMLRVTVQPTESEAGLALDTGYLGKASTTPFVAEFKPEDWKEDDYQVAYYPPVPDLHALLTPKK